MKTSMINSDIICIEKQTLVDSIIQQECFCKISISKVYKCTDIPKMQILEYMYILLPYGTDAESFDCVNSDTLATHPDQLNNLLKDDLEIEAPSKQLLYVKSKAMKADLIKLVQCIREIICDQDESPYHPELLNRMRTFLTDLELAVKNVHFRVDATARPALHPL